MAAFADALLQDVLNEIGLRDPGFLERKSVGFPAMAELVAWYGRRPPFIDLAPAEIERRLTLGLDFFFARGLRRDDNPAAQSRLAAVLCDAAMDAYAAEAGEIPLAPLPRRAETLAEVIAADYDARSIDGIDYLVRREGRTWLVVVNALGIPLDAWSRLLGDRSHDYKVVVVETESTELIGGGMRTPAALSADVERITRVMDAEGIEAAHVVGWCSGGRVAAQLAAEQPGRVKSLVLVSTTFRGSPGSEARPSQFEEDLGGLLDSVARAPDTAPFLSELLSQSGKAAPPPSEDVVLFRLPAQDQAGILIAPMATGDDLKAYCARITADRAHPTAEALAKVQAPILAIAGRHDHVLSNEHTWEVLNAHASGVQGVTVAGAGHYVHDLQYPYFRMLLDAFTEGRPVAAARLEPR